jgi:hypothetical protein
MHRQEIKRLGSNGVEKQTKQTKQIANDTIVEIDFIDVVL